jgi:hypothetical protein
MLCVTPISMNAMNAIKRIDVLDFDVSEVQAEPSPLLNFDDSPVKLGGVS